MRHWLLFWTTLAVLGSASTEARAQAARAGRSGEYTLTHSAITVVALAGGIGLKQLPLTAGSDFDWFPPDRNVRSNNSQLSAKLSNVSWFGTVLGPALVYLPHASGGERTNAGLIYAESLSLNFLVTTGVKIWVRRPRPYVQAEAARDSELTPERDASTPTRKASPFGYRSFYSGHTSLSFGAAVTGSLLLGETDAPHGLKAAVWGGELALASLTGHLRVRAGRHYYTDVFAGALFGTAVGAVLPALHGLERGPTWLEAASGVSGIALGWTLGYLSPTSDAAPAVARHLLALRPALFENGELGLTYDLPL